MPPANTVLLLLGLVLSIASGCSTDDDCEQLGSCVAGACVCSRGWSGPSCGSLNLLPAAPLATSRLWPSAEAHDAGFASAWGFTHTFEPSDNLHHGWVTVACGASGVVGQGGGNSFIAHVTAPSAIGPYALAATAPMFTPQTCFGPHVVRARDGTLALVFRVNLLINTTICAGDSAVPAPGIASHPSIPDSELVSGDPEKGTSIYIATAKTASGPWEVVRTEIVGDGTIHNSNPSLWQLLAPLPTGETWALGYRFNPKGGERNAIAVAHDVRGPWRSVANVSAGLSGAEDPFAFQVRGRRATTHVVGDCTAYSRLRPPPRPQPAG